MRLIHLCGAACIASLLPSEASAKLIFDQSVDLTFSGYTSELRFPQFADDFQLQSGSSTITDVHWWGLYCCTPHTQPDNFTIRIFADINGLPGANPLNEFVVGNAVNRTDTGEDVAGQYNVYSYSANISPLALSAGTTYWLSILNDPPEDGWGWSYDGSAGGSKIAYQFEEGSRWIVEGVSGDRVGFQLTNDAIAVPEPATWALFAAGLAGLGWMSRRRAERRQD